MTRYDQQILFTALAFVAVVLKDGESIQLGSAQKVKLLANLLGDFCTENVSTSFACSIIGANDESDLTEIDAAIEKNIHELRRNAATILPTNKAVLCKLYERLQLFKIKRINAALFDSISDQKLSNFVLSQFREEIEERGAAL